MNAQNMNTSDISVETIIEALGLKATQRVDGTLKPLIILLKMGRVALCP